MAERRSASHAEAEQVLRAAGYSQERIEELLRDLPDPFDLERYGDALVKRGMTAGQLMERRGSSP
jgi:hypothetical protein